MAAAVQGAPWVELSGSEPVQAAAMSHSAAGTAKKRIIRNVWISRKTKQEHSKGREGCRNG